MNKNPLVEEKNYGIISRQKLIVFLKELFRKSIHMCSAFIPLFLKWNYVVTIVLLLCVLTLYIVSEILRLNKINIPVISTITEAASRSRDKNRFVMGPVTLVIGITSCALLFDLHSSTIGIFALAFGDGLASLTGRFLGRIKIPFTKGKTVCGSLTCFAAIFISCLIFLFCIKLNLSMNYFVFSLIIAATGAFVELLPLKDYDNLFIPLIVGGLSQLLFNLCTVA